MLRHSHDFDTLPSERAPRAEQAPAARALHKLARKAVHYRPDAGMVPGDQATRAHRKLKATREAGGRVELVWETRPGAFIQDEPKEVRRVLCDLTSAGIASIDPEIDRFRLHDFAMHPKPGKRYLFGPICAEFPAYDGDAEMPLMDDPKIWTMS